MAQQIIQKVQMPLKGLYTAAVADAIDPTFSPWCQNVRFRFGKIVRPPGRSAVLSTIPNLLMDFGHWTDNNGKTNVLGLGAFWPISNAAYPYDDQSHTFGTGVPLTPATQLDSRFSWAQGEEQLLVTRASQISAVNAASGTYTSTVLTRSPQCMFVTYFKNHTFALNILGYPNYPPNYVPPPSTPSYPPIAVPAPSPAKAPSRIQWSALGDYTDWVYIQTNDGLYHGGFLDLYDGRVEPITGGQPLGDRLVIYRPSTITDLIATGDPTQPFLPENRVLGIGNAAPWSLVSLGQFHMFLANDYNIYTWDGNNLNAVGTPVHNYVRSLFDPTQTTGGLAPFGAAFMGYKEYWLVFQTGNGRSVILIYDYLRDTWTRDEIEQLTGLQESVTYGADSSPGFQQGYPMCYPTMLAGNLTQHFLIDERIKGDWVNNVGTLEMFVHTADQYWDPSGLKNATVERVVVNQDPPTGETFDPKYLVEISLDKGQTFPVSVPIYPTATQDGWQFADFNVTGPVRRYRFHYDLSEHQNPGDPTWRAYSEIYVPSGDYFPPVDPVLIPTPSAYEGEDGVLMDEDVPVPTSVR